MPPLAVDDDDFVALHFDAQVDTGSRHTIRAAAAVKASAAAKVPAVAGSRFLTASTGDSPTDDGDNDDERGNNSDYLVLGHVLTSHCRGPELEPMRPVLSGVADPALRAVLQEAHAERLGIWVAIWPVTLLVLSFIAILVSTCPPTSSATSPGLPTSTPTPKIRRQPELYSLMPGAKPLESMSGVFILAGRQDSSIRQDEVDREEIVEGEGVLAHEPAKAAPERQARDARRRDHASGRRETMELRFTVELIPCEPPLRAGGAGLRIDVNALHERQVDHQAVVDRGATRDVVAASPDGDLELLIARQLHGISDVGQTAAAGDERRPLVDESVMDLPGFVITCLAREEEWSGERAGERGHGF